MKIVVEAKLRNNNQCEIKCKNNNNVSRVYTHVLPFLLRNAIKVKVSLDEERKKNKEIKLKCSPKVNLS